MEKSSFKKPEIWGGIECSYNRVRDLYMDQLVFSGHYDRIESDLQLIAGLGVKAIRYPVIWERLQPTHDAIPDLQGAVGLPLQILREKGINVIAGLVHHGSGPRYADLASEEFAPGLSRFAENVARTFPWIEHYTPVNEPLTTARFSGLYGLWYPHANDDRIFAHAFVNQMKAVVLSMQAIRKINSTAKLVQTEDLAKIYSTPELEYQATFENHRRWLTWDFLCGKMDAHHPLWNFFIEAGMSESDLNFFLENPCPPDLIGVDYYATSERYLDHRYKMFPRSKWGGNHVQRYADVEAFRVQHDHPSGIKVLLKECWERYQLPIAITEVHINCDQRSQVRWFYEIWSAACEALNQGVDIRSVTAWALLGSFGWDKLLTQIDGNYESGVFSVRSGTIKPTRLASFLKEFTLDPNNVPAAALEPGWWEKDDRFLPEHGGELVEQCLVKGKV